MSKIKLICRMLKILFRLVSVIIIVASTYLILFHTKSYLAWSMNSSFLLTLPIQHTHFSFPHRLVILAIEALPLTFTVLICLRLSKLFQAFEQGYLFELKNVANIQRIGIYMILSKCIQLIYQPTMSISLTYNNNIGERLASISIGEADFSSLMTAIIIFVAAMVMQEAYKLKSDSELTI